MQQQSHKPYCGDHISYFILIIYLKSEHAFLSLLDKHSLNAISAQSSVAAPVNTYIKIHMTTYISAIFISDMVYNCLKD